MCVRDEAMVLVDGRGQVEVTDGLEANAFTESQGRRGEAVVGGEVAGVEGELGGHSCSAYTTRADLGELCSHPGPGIG